MQPGPGMQRPELPGVKEVKYMIAVASGKGGVGKSTVAANLALALQQHGQRVGLMDADIYGPSVPMMMGLGTVDQRTTPFPIIKYGIKLMSMGFLVDPSQAIIWRGPKVAQAVAQFLGAVDWGQLDFLIIDLPPGTGDAQLTLTQSAPLTGAVVVTTPQDISLIDARKGVKMFNEVRVPVLGVVENMSYFMGDDGKRYEIFSHGGGAKLAQEANVPLLGQIPIDPRITECGDHGEPMVLKYSDSPVAAAYRELALKVMDASATQAALDDILPEVQL
jgi:ATP-binding protein involved in chromosome partitioning